MIQVVGTIEGFKYKEERHHIISRFPLPTKSVPEQVKINPNFIDYTGFEVGSLKVLGMSRSVKKRWVVRCICGNYELRKSMALKFGGERSRCSVCDKRLTGGYGDD